jgi:hypothetical protein
MCPIKDAILILKTGKQEFSGEFLFSKTIELFSFPEPHILSMNTLLLPSEHQICIKIKVLQGKC